MRRWGHKNKQKANKYLNQKKLIEFSNTKKKHWPSLRATRGGSQIIQHERNARSGAIPAAFIWRDHALTGEAFAGPEVDVPGVLFCKDFWYSSGLGWKKLERWREWARNTSWTLLNRPMQEIPLRQLSQFHPSGASMRLQKYTFKNLPGSSGWNPLWNGEHWVSNG